MGITPGQQAHYVSSVAQTSSGPIAIPATTAGSGIAAIVSVGSAPSAAHVSGVVDSSGTNVWSKLCAAPGGAGSEIWYTPGPGSASITSATVSLSASSTMTVRIIELKGAGAGDVASATNGVGIGALSGALTSAQNGEIALSLITWLNQTTITPSSSVVNRGQGAPPGTGIWNTPAVATFEANPQAGSSVLVGITTGWFINPPKAGPITIEDTAGNTYFQVAAITSPTNGAVGVYIYKADDINLPSDGSLLSVQVAIGWSYNTTVVAQEVIGGTIGTPQETTSGEDSGGTGSLSLSITTAVANELLWSVWTPKSAASSSSISSSATEEFSYPGSGGAPLFVLSSGFGGGLAQGAESIAASYSTAQAWDLVGAMVAIEPLAGQTWTQLGQQTCSVGTNPIAQISGYNLLGGAGSSAQYGPAQQASTSAWSAAIALIAPATAGTVHTSVVAQDTLPSLMDTAAGVTVLSPVAIGRPPQLQLLVNGQDLSAYVTQDKWMVTQQWSAGQGASAQIQLEEQFLTPGQQRLSIPPFSTIQLVDKRLSELIFGGLVYMPQYQYQGPLLSLWQLWCMDGTFLANQSVAGGSFVNQTADAIVSELVAQSGCGLTTNNVMPGPQLPSCVITPGSLSTAITTVAQYCSGLGSQSVQWGWFVDDEFDIHFFTPSQIAPTGNLFADNPLAAYGHYDWSFWYRWDGSNLINSAIVSGGNWLAPFTDTWVGNGSQTSWLLTWSPDSSAPNLSLKVGGVAQTVAVVSQGSTPTTQYVVIQTDNGYSLQTGVSTTGATTAPPSSGTVIALSYSYDAPINTQVNDLDSQAQYASLPNKGIFTTYLQDTTLSDWNSARLEGEAELAEFSTPEEHVIFTTTEDWSGHTRTGDVIQWQNAFVPDSQNDYIPGLDAYFLVISSTIQGKPGMYRTYRIEAIRVDQPNAALFGGIYGSARYGAAVYT